MEPYRRRHLPVIVAAAISLAFAVQSTPSYVRLVVWAICLLGVLLFVSGVSGVRDALVDEFNRYTLQRVIALGWFVVIASAFLGISLWNVAGWKVTGGARVPAFVEIDASIWALAGVVLGGLVGNGVVNSIHANTPPKDGTGARENALWPDPRREASMYRNLEAAEAEPADVAKNRQFGVQNTIDMSAVQQLMFQAAVLVAYVVAVGRLVAATGSDAAIQILPGLPTELLALLSVSTMAQVGNAAIPKAKVEAAAPRATERFWLEGVDLADKGRQSQGAMVELVIWRFQMM